MTTMHELKTDCDSFHQIWHSRKLFELRPDDRNFQVGDVLLLREHGVDANNEPKYSKRSLLMLVVYVLRNVPEYGLQPGFAALSLKFLARLENNLPCGMETKP